MPYERFSEFIPGRVIESDIVGNYYIVLSTDKKVHNRCSSLFCIGLTTRLIVSMDSTTISESLYHHPGIAYYTFMALRGKTLNFRKLYLKRETSQKRGNIQKWLDVQSAVMDLCRLSYEVIPNPLWAHYRTGRYALMLVDERASELNGPAIPLDDREEFAVILAARLLYRQVISCLPGLDQVVQQAH